MPDDLWRVEGMVQSHQSSKTSINSSKLPATFAVLERLNVVLPGMVIADIGGGRFDNGIEWATKKGASLIIFDPFNRSSSHNQEASRHIAGGRADIAMLNNVLNVIREPDNRQRALRQAKDALKPEGTLYVLIYEGNRSGIGHPTKNGESWQCNRVLSDYLPEVRAVFGNAILFKGLIMAKNTPTAALIEQARAMGIPMRHQGIVGKKIGGSLYVHRSAEDVLPQEWLKEAKELLPEGFDYQIVKHVANENSFSFIQSPDFDAAEEPISGNSIKISGGKIVARTAQKKDPNIYHHKWLFVRDDYPGFDTLKSIQRSLHWCSLDNVDKSRIGTKSYWEREVLTRLKDSQ